jgi:hypothetical protein
MGRDLVIAATIDEVDDRINMPVRAESKYEGRDIFLELMNYRSERTQCDSKRASSSTPRHL